MTLAMPRRKDIPADGRKARRTDPPYMAWRDARPAWIPGPALRRAGWRTINLKSNGGQWLPRAAARTIAREINEDVARWQAGEKTRRFSPGGTPATIHSPAASQRTLESAWGHFETSRQYRALAPATRACYRKDLKRFLDRFGEEHPATMDRALFSAWWEAEFDRLYATLAMGWTEDRWLAAPRHRDVHGAAFVPEARNARYAALDAAREEGGNVPGQGQMNGIQRAVSRLYRHLLDELRWPGVLVNPARGFGARGLKPRLVLPDDGDLAILVETADDLGHHCIGDALVFLANIGQRPGDMVRRTLNSLDTGRITGRIRKTGATVDVRIPDTFMKRLTMIRTRRAAMGGKWPETLLATEDLRVPLTTDRLRHLFALIRDRAARKRPAVARLIPYDFRKMAITRYHLSGASRDQIAGVTAHSYKTVSDILDHYIVPSREDADATIEKFNTWQAERGVKW